MKGLAFILCIYIFVTGCQHVDKTANTHDTVNNDVTADTPYFEKGVNYVQLIPDSLRNQEDIELIEKLKILPRYLKEENGEVVFTLSKKEFLALGIPEQYYNLVLKDVKSMNKMFKENNVKNIDSLLQTYPSE